MGFLLPLRKFKRAEDNAALLQQCRKTMCVINSGYKKTVEGLWEVADQTFRTPEGADGVGVRILLHTPKDHELSGDLPLVVWAHGGGLNMGSAEEQFGATFFKDLAARCKFCWASVDYRLAPEAKFPAAVDDMIQAYTALKDPAFASRFGYNPQKVSLAGVSSGAFLAIHATLKLARDFRKDCPVFLASLCPMADPAVQGDSHRLFGDLPMCPTSWIRWCWQAQLSESFDIEPSEERIKEASLLRADWGPCKGLPVLNAVAPFDALADEGKTLSTLMAAAGVNVEEVSFGGSHCMSAGYPGSNEEVLLRFCRMLSL